MDAFEIWRFLPVILATPAQLAFLYIFVSKRAGGGNWWKDVVGRALFFNALGLALLLVIACLVYFMKFYNNQYTGVDWYFAHTKHDGFINVSYWVVAVAIYYQLYSLIKLRF